MTSCFFLNVCLNCFPKLLCDFLVFHLFWHAPLGVRSTKRRHQSPEWTILSHASCFIQGEVIGFQVLLDCLHPHSTRASWWSPPVLQSSLVLEMDYKEWTKISLLFLEVDRILALVSVLAPNVDKWALSADIRFRPTFGFGRKQSYHIRCTFGFSGLQYCW